MFSLFEIVLFLAPLPTCFVLVRYLRSHRDELKAKLLGLVQVQAGGVLATYVAVLLLFIAALDPGTLGLNVNYAQSSWNFRLTLPSEDKPATINGVINLANGPRDSLRINGTIDDTDIDLAFKPGGLGLQSESQLFIELKLPDQTVDYAAFGHFTSTRNPTTLYVVGLESEASQSASIHPGTMSLERRWPWIKLAVLSVFPIGIVFLLSKIGPLRATVEGDFERLPKYIKYYMASINLRFAGGSAAYALLFVLLIFFHLGAPQSLADMDQKSLEQASLISGKWYFYLHHAMPDDEYFPPEYTGNLIIDPGTLNGDMKIAGTTNRLFKPSSYRYDDASSCYTTTQPGRGGFDWDTIASVVVDGQLIAIYRSNESGSGNSELGIFLGTVRNSEVHNWIFRDFQDINRPDAQVNSGDMLVFKPGSPSQKPCDQYSDEWELLVGEE